MVIVGAGHTGGRAAQGLRQAGWAGPVTLIGAEGLAPYERPPLSKDVLLGAKSIADCALLDTGFYAESGVDLRTGARVVEIRRDREDVVLDDGSTVPYERLLLAMGAEPRRLAVPGGELDGVQYLRDAADADALKGRLSTGKRIVIIGGGFIGLEVAAAAAGRDCRVVVVEVAGRLLARGVPVVIEEQMRKRHLSAGVEIALNRRVEAVLGEGRVTGVRLDDGREIACDTVVIGIGVTPRVDLAEAAGLAIDNGIAVNPTLQSEDPRIFAAGDVCSFLHALFDRRIRLESWQNAEDHGPLAARNMLGAAEPCGSVPWMWSDQYEWTIQVAGMPDLGVQGIERRLGPDAVVIFHLEEGGRLVGVSGIGPNAVINKAIKLGQMMIEKRRQPEPILLADPTSNLKALVRQEGA